MTKVVMERFGSVREKTVHAEKILLDDGWHLKCEWLNCPGQMKKNKKSIGICLSIIFNDTINTKFCFCG